MVLFCARAARRRCAFAGAACMVLGALSPGPGCTDSSVRAVAGGGSAAQKQAQPLHAGFVRVASVAAQVSAGDACGPRPLTAGLNDRRARAEPSAGAALPVLFRLPARAGVTARARAPVAALRSTPAPLLPAASSSRKSKLTPCCLSRAAPAAASAQSSKRTLSLRGATRCPAASCHHGGGRLAPLPLALGRGPPLFINELGLPHDHLYHNSEVAVGARRDHDQETTHKRNGAQGRRACLHRSITMQTHQRRARAHKFNCQGL